MNALQQGFIETCETTARTHVELGIVDNAAVGPAALRERGDALVECARIVPRQADEDRIAVDLVDELRYVGLHLGHLALALIGKEPEAPTAPREARAHRKQRTPPEEKRPILDMFRPIFQKTVANQIGIDSRQMLIPACVPQHRSRHKTPNVFRH